MKSFVIFAGVNGAGKTTLYQTNEEYMELPRVNLDEIVRNIGSWKSKRDVAKAGIIAVNMIKGFFKDGASFNQETTLCGRSIIQNIYKAKSLGYYIDLNYVGLESSDLAIERVEKRVAAGGHGIPSSDIIRRYNESLQNLKRIIPICDRVKIYDNTKSFRKIASYINGSCTDLTNDIPNWFMNVLQ